MVNVANISTYIARLAMLKFFPADPEARTSIVGMVCEMADNDGQVDWLTRRMLVLYNEWPGPKELRALFCSRHKPSDGIEAKSEKFLEGIPSEKKPEPMKALPPGSVASADPSAERAIRLLAKSLDLNRALRPRKSLAAAVVPNPHFKPITQADVDRVLREKIDKAARVELGEPA